MILNELHFRIKKYAQKLQILSISLVIIIFTIISLLTNFIFISINKQCSASKIIDRLFNEKIKNYYHS